MTELEHLAEKGEQVRVIPKSWKKVQHVVLGTEAQGQVELPKHMRDITRASDTRSEWQKTRHRIGHALSPWSVWVNNTFFSDSGLSWELILLLRGQ